MGAASFFSGRRVAGALGLGALAGVAAYARFVEPAWIETTRTVVPWRGPRLRIALLTDLHARPGGERRIERIVRRASSVGADVVLLGGDYVEDLDVRGGKLDAVARLAGLRSRLGTFAVLGNHDSENAEGGEPREPAIASALRRAGARVLANERVTLDDGVVLVGMGSFRAGRTDARAAFAGADPSAATLVLVHNWRSLSEPGVGTFDLAMAGHTHGGQGCVPFTEVCPFMDDDMPPFRAGLYDWPSGGKLYVSRGLGESGIRARFAARPEVAVLDLVGEKTVLRGPEAA